MKSPTFKTLSLLLVGFLLFLLLAGFEREVMCSASRFDQLSRRVDHQSWATRFAERGHRLEQVWYRSNWPLPRMSREAGKEVRPVELIIG
jgi:hypothetical protein